MKQIAGGKAVSGDVDLEGGPVGRVAPGADDVVRVGEEEAARTASLKAVWLTVSTTGEAVTRASWTFTSLKRPAATTPFSRASRAGASQGIARASIVPAAVPGRADINSSVAAS